MTPTEYVLKFTQAFKQHIGTEPALPPDDVLRLRMRLLAEEFFEALYAVYGRGACLDISETELMVDISTLPVRASLPDLADALADMDYVARGTALACGYDYDAVLMEVCRSNDTKLAGSWVDETGKVRKGAGYQPPNVCRAMGMHPLERARLRELLETTDDEIPRGER
jgi:predicted HAD superfamily Cof-like phosphohydrolase